jgi:hypothetical protein
MTIRFLAVVAAALIVQTPAVVAQGWQQTVSGGFTPDTSLQVNSKEGNAILTVACSKGTGLTLDIDLKPNFGFPDYVGSGADAITPIRTRFIRGPSFVNDLYGKTADTTAAVETVWTSGGGIGYPQKIESRDALQLFTQFAGATAFQAELQIYGRGLLVATFGIATNRDVLEQFMARCH